MKFKYIFLILLTLTLISVMGCSTNPTKEKDNIAYISANINSEYENTFKDLGLGLIYDFNIKLPYADKSWVNIWVEGYRRGKRVEPFPLTGMSYGLSPKKVEEGRVGLGIINPQTENELFLLYAPYVRNAPSKIENNPISAGGCYSWGYAIEDESVGLKSGETKIIGVYWQGIDCIRTYNLQDADAIKQMINEEEAVLLLKIKVEEREE